MRLIALLCACIIFLGSINVFAITFTMTPREIDLENGLVFWKVLSDFDGYPEPGLYLDGELVYGVDIDPSWWGSTLFFSDDAMSFLLVDDWGNIRFYNKGVFVHSYSVTDLLEGGEDAIIVNLDIPSGGRTWHWQPFLSYDRQNNILQFTTVESMRITFDLTTGLIVSREELIMSIETPRNNLVTFAVVGIVCISVIVLLRRFRNAKRV